MTKVQTALLISVLLLIPVAYSMLNQTTKVIKIPQLKIEPKAKIETITAEAPSNILSKLKTAVESSNEKSIPTQKEQAEEILQALKKNIKVIEVPKAKIVHIKKNIPKPKKQKPKITKIKKSTPSRKKPKQKVVKKIYKKPKEKVKITIKKKTPTKTVKEVTTIEPVKVVSMLPRLSREEELAEYYQKTQNGLEVVGESKLFKIDKPTSTVPDSYYFKPIKESKHVKQKGPLEEVQTLGVVEVSKKYEVSNEIPKMIELAKEAKVDIASASIETEELKKLEFVNTLEVLEVSPDFETIEATKYIK